MPTTAPVIQDGSMSQTGTRPFDVFATMQSWSKRLNVGTRGAWLLFLHALMDEVGKALFAWAIRGMVINLNGVYNRAVHHCQLTGCFS